MAHPLAVLGLVLNIVGVGLLLWFPPVLSRFTKDGGTIIDWVNNPTPEGLRRYKRQTWAFRVAIGAILAGFFLQPIDLLSG